MNTGQHLVALSGLASGTAAAHLLAIQAGGSGPGQTVFASQFAVTFETPRYEVSRKARPAPTEAVLCPPSVAESKDLKGLYCTVAGTRLDTGVAADEMTIRIGQHRTLFVCRADRKQYTKKGTK